MSISLASSPGAIVVKGGKNRNTANVSTGSNNNSSITYLTLLRFYLKVFVYLLIIIFVLLQYIYWENSTSTILESQQMLSQQPPQSQQQLLREEKQQPPPSAPDITTKIHIVFSTGCNAFQDWQSYLFFYQIWKSGQTGNVTRVASGCNTPYEEQQLHDVFRKEIQDGIPTSKDRFHLHITPDYSRTLIPGKTYKFFNKPCGLLHWMEHALKMPQSIESGEYSDTLFIILDPDQFILRPYTSNDFYRPIYDTQRHMYWHTPVPQNDKRDHNRDEYIVREGYPMGQLYMFGSRFMDRVNLHLDTIVEAADKVMYNNTAFRNIVNNPTTYNKKSNLYSWTHADVNNYYVAGPPYIAMGYDMYRIVTTWASIVVPVYHACDGDFLSEMYAYTTAIGHLNLKHLLGYNFMISEPDIHLQEGWNDIDTIPDNEICSYTHNNSTDVSTIQWHTQYYPNVVHYCQRYYLGPYFFNKYRLPHTFLTCDHPLYLDPTVDDMSNTSIVNMYDSAITPDHTVYNNIPMLQRKRLAIMLCIVIGGLNDAATYWKQQNCIYDNGNYDKTYFVPPDQKKPRR